MKIKNSHAFNIIATICRIVVGAIFVFSGLIKSIDPWGTALKIAEYFTAFNIEWLSWSTTPLAIGQCALELILGLLLIFGIWKKSAAFLTMLFVAFFTTLTLVIAIWNPVDDCGCFGDALKISNWATFAKNAILLPMSILAWIQVRTTHKWFPTNLKQAAFVSFCTAMAVTINICSWYNLPLIDTFEYKKGTNLRQDILCSSCIEKSMILVYKDMQTEELKEFTITDTTWHDTSRWQYIDTRSSYDNIPTEIADYNFSLMNLSGDIASDVVYNPGISYLIMVRYELDATSKHFQQIEQFVNHLSDQQRKQILFVEGFDSEFKFNKSTITIGDHTLPMAGMYRKVMARILRADAGIIVINDGIISEKQSCRNIEKTNLNH